MKNYKALFLRFTLQLPQFHTNDYGRESRRIDANQAKQWSSQDYWAVEEEYGTIAGDGTHTKSS